ILDHAGELLSRCDTREFAALDDVLVECVPGGDLAADPFRVRPFRRYPRLLVRLDALRRGRQPHLRPRRRFDGLLFRWQVGLRPPPGIVVDWRAEGIDAHARTLATSATKCDVTVS